MKVPGLVIVCVGIAWCCRWQEEQMFLLPRKQRRHFAVGPFSESAIRRFIFSTLHQEPSVSATRNRPTDTVASGATSTRRKNASSTWSGMAWGLGVTVLFYLIAPFPATLFSGGPEFYQRYFCGHPLEYITSAIFFIGMAILWKKFRCLPTERRAIEEALRISEDNRWSQLETDPGEVAATMESWLQASSIRNVRETVIGQRFNDVVHHVTRRPDSPLDDHLKYLADLAVDRLTQSFQLVRTVTWAVPIMGFLGTVIGITMAIANVTPEQLDSSLPEVTSGLAVAFDTTAQALGMSMILVFGTFLVERSEQSVLNETEQFGIDTLLPCFDKGGSSSITSGDTAVAQWTAEMLAQQSEFWNAQFASLQTDWQATLNRQTATLAQTLTNETEATLNAHRDSLGMARDHYAVALQQSSEAIAQQFQTAISTFVQRVDAWQSAMQTTSVSAAGQAEELHRLGRTLLQMTESEERLIHLQEQLNQNLQTLRVVETLEQTVNSLNAAVAVLTAKTHLRAVA
jgi:biopolymer transport protein ExbB/TolQ